MISVTLKNQSSLPVLVYFYRAAVEESVTAMPGALISLEQIDSLSPSTESLLKDGILKRVTGTIAAPRLFQSVQAFGLGYTGPWNSSFLYNRGNVAAWNGATWVATRGNSGEEPSLVSGSWTRFGLFDAGFLSGQDISSIPTNSVLSVVQTDLGKAWLAAPLTGTVFSDSSIQMEKVAGLTSSLDGKLPLTGGVMTGHIQLAPNPTSGTHAVSKDYADTKVSASGGSLTGVLQYAEDVAVTAPRHLAPKSYVDSVFSNQLPVTGGAMTGFLTLVNQNPIQDWHAVPKVYADSKLSRADGGTVSSPILYSQSVSILSPLQLVHRDYADTKLARAGGTMTGFLTLVSDPANPLHAATKQYVDGRALAGGLLTGLLSLPSTIPLTSPLNLTPKSYVDSVVSQALALSGGTMTGFLTLSASPTNPLHAATKQYVDSVTGTGGDVLMRSGGVMTGAITGSHGLIQANGLLPMTGPLALASLTSSPVSSTITGVTNAGGGSVWLALDSSSGWTTTMTAKVSGTSSYDGTRRVLEVSTSPARIRVQAAFTTSQTGSAVATQVGLFQEQDGRLSYSGSYLASAGRTLEVDADYEVQPQDGLLLVDASQAAVVITLPFPDGFREQPITIKKVGYGEAPVIVQDPGFGRNPSLILRHAGEGVSLTPANGCWLRSERPKLLTSTAFDWGVLLEQPGQTSVRVLMSSLETRFFKITAIADGGGGELDLTMSSVSGLQVGARINITGSRFGYNGTKTVLAIVGSVVSVSGTFVATEALYATSLVETPIQTSPLMRVATGQEPKTSSVSGSITAVSDNGDGTVDLAIGSTLGWSTQMVATVTGTTSYNGDYDVIEVGANYITIRATFSSTETGSVAGSLGAELSESPNRDGPLLGSGSGYSLFRADPEGFATAVVSTAYNPTEEIIERTLHVLSCDGRTVSTKEAFQASQAGPLLESIVSISDAGSGSIWLVLGEVSGFRAGDEIAVADTTSYNGSYTISEVDLGNSRVKVARAYSASETGTLISKASVSLSAPEGTPLEEGSILIVDGATALGCEVASLVVDKVLQTSPSVKVSSRSTRPAASGSPDGTAWIGSSIQVLMVKPWTWLKEEAELDGSSVSSWNDISGNSRPASATGSDRPSFVTLGVNGYPSISFSATKILTIPFSKAAPFTVFLVFKATQSTPAANETILSGSTTNRIVFRRLTNGSYSLAGGGSTLTSSTAITTDLASVYTIRINGAFSFVRRGGNQIISGTIPVSSVDDFLLGDFAKTASAAGSFAEFQVYTTPLSMAQVEYIENCLASRY